MSINQQSTKRGDTFIEVMFALAVFSLVAVLSIAMMNAGIATSERSLELVTARNEINAQAEALRFVHSAYTSELTLPECSAVASGEACQQYKQLWETIIDGAKLPHDDADPDNTARYSIPSPLTTCQEVYADDNKLLKENNAFILNTRTIGTNPAGSFIPASTEVPGTDQYIFQEAPLGARVVFTQNQGEYDEESEESSAYSNADSLSYNQVGRAEGIWIVAVKDAQERYYDFYIQSCWYGTGTSAPTSLDTIVRLYNSGAV